MVKLDEKDLYQLLIAEFRYAVKRDNHLAPDTCAQHVKNYLPEMTTQWRAHAAKQLTEEIIDERLWSSHHTKPDFRFEKRIDNPLSLTPKKQLAEDGVWEDLLIFLANYLESLPNNANKYMEHIYGHMDYSKGVDYYAEVRNKIIEERI